MQLDIESASLETEARTAIRIRIDDTGPCIRLPALILAFTLELRGYTYYLQCSQSRREQQALFMFEVVIACLSSQIKVLLFEICCLTVTDMIYTPWRTAPRRLAQVQ